MSIYTPKPIQIAVAVLVSALLVSGYSYSSVSSSAGENELIGQPQIESGPTINAGADTSNGQLLTAVNANSTTTKPGNTLLPVPASIELRADKTLRIRWKPSNAADYYRVLESLDGISAYTAISEKLPAPTNSFDHRLVLHASEGARYRVEACNASGCTLSVQQLIEGNLMGAGTVSLNATGR